MKRTPAAACRVCQVRPRLRSDRDGGNMVSTNRCFSQRAVTVVDDEPAARDVLARAARSFRFECQTANSAEQAVELLERQLTPLVVTDLRMPGRGGMWLVQEGQK